MVEIAIAPQGHRTDMKPYPEGNIAALREQLTAAGLIHPPPQLANRQT
jgi:hypothetical protein